MTTSNSLAIYQGMSSNPMAAAQSMGEAIAKSGLVPVPNTAAGTVVAMTCMLEGITPLAFGRTYHIIKGKPSKKAHAMLAEFRQAFGGKHRVIEHTPDRCEVEFTFEGHTHTESLTWDQCKESRWPWVNPNDHNQGLKDNWSTPIDRKNMMFARLVSSALRVLCPEINFGIYTPEEVYDIEADIIESAPVVGAHTQLDPPPGENQLPAVVEPEVVEEVSAVEIEDEAPFDEAELLASDVQVARVKQLVKLCGLTKEQIVGMLEKRGVAKVAELTSELADELIARLEEVERKKRASS